MKNNHFIICCLILLAPLTLSCSKNSDNGTAGGVFGLGAAAVESLPQVRSDAAGKRKSPLTTGNIEDHGTLAKFFKLECFMPGSDNFCPAGVDTSGGDTNPYKLTSYTLIGSIYHADMYSGGLKTACEGTAATLTEGSFVSARAGGDPVRFLLDYYDLLTCVNQVDATDAGGGRSIQAHSVDGNLEYQATLTARYRYPYNGVADPGQNDIFQVYVGLNNGSPVLLAFNYAGADTMYQRTVLLVNLETHRFAVKHYENASPHDPYLVAIGVGGVDRETGELNAGYYYIKFTNNSGTEDDGCADNATGDFQGDATPCSDASVPMAWSGSAAVAEYLSMTSGDTARLAAFLSVFENDDPLAETDSPSNSADDPELYIPYSITP